MKRKIYTIALLTLAAVVILLTLNATIDKPNKQNNGFVRKFTGEKAVLQKQANFGVELRGVCGKLGDSLFLQGKEPGKIYVANTGLDRLDTINLNLPDIPKLQTGFNTYVIYPKVYILASNARCLIVANMLDGTHEKITIRTAGAFVNSIMINPGAFVIREIDSNTLNAHFKILDISGVTVKSETDISIRLRDAGFSYSGSLNYDEQGQKLIYVTSYLNKIFCFDTNLKLVYRVHTIDTNNLINTALEKGGDGVTYKKPPVTINRYSSLYNEILYVNSMLKADNESEKDFNHSLVIDQYNTGNGNYIGSFYLQNFSDHKSLKFGRLQDGRLWITQKNNLMIYNFSKIL